MLIPLKRRLVLTLIALCSIGGGAWVILDTIGMGIKGTESRSVGLAVDSIEALTEHGVILPEGVDAFDLALEIKQPIKEEIHSTMSAYGWTAAWMFLIGIAILLSSWLPTARRDRSEIE